MVITLAEVAGTNDTAGDSSVSSDKTGLGISSETYGGSSKKGKNLGEGQHPPVQDSTYGGDARDTGADNPQVPYLTKR